MENNIKIVRFKDHLDIVCYVEEIENNKVILSNPLTFEIRNGNLLLQQLLPVGMIKENKITVSENDILGMMEPEEHFLEYYMTTVEKLNNARVPKSKEQDEEKEHLVSVMEALNEMDNTKNLILH